MLFVINKEKNQNLLIMTQKCVCRLCKVHWNNWRATESEIDSHSTSFGFELVSRRQTTIQVNFIDLYGSHVYVVCFISRPPNCVRKLLCNLRTLKRLVASIYLQFLHCRRDIQRFSSSKFLQLDLFHFLNGLNPYEPLHMATGAHWQDPIGLETIRTIVRTIIPTWRDGLHPVQLELVSSILDGQDILCCTATGDGKSAAFAITGLILTKYNAHPDAYPAGLPTRKRPIGVVITPTKGLANNTFSSFVLTTF